MTINCNSYTSSRGFRKAEPSAVAFTKTAANTATTATDIYVEVNNQAVVIPANTSITMPTLAVGTDYVIWVTPTGTIQATNDYVTPPVANSRKIGGFHYAPGGNATANTGGDTTSAINSYSFWDLKYRPTCKDPRGMTCVAESFWCDIYLTGVDAITNGSSKYNVTIADGSAPPKIPTMFGGSGSSTYGSYTWFEAMELAIAFGKKCPTQQEYMAACYGVTEQTSRGSDPVSTILDAPRTSKWGLIGATGNLLVWGRDRGGPVSSPATESRGTQGTTSNASLFGGAWTYSSNSGSRCSYWGGSAETSDSSFGSRFVCDHLILD
jgi:hypothetical protein